MNTLLETAIRYHGYGLSIVPIIAHKKPLGSWHALQRAPMTEEQIVASFADPAVQALAIVCGQVSGGFEGFDIDNKNDPSRSLLTRFTQRLQNTYPLLYEKLVAATTQHEGGHLYYRSGGVEGSLLLARRPVTPAEKTASPNVSVKVLLETRGEGSYIIVPPSVGYAFVHRDLADLPVIEPIERNQLLDLARSFNLYTEPAVISSPARVPRAGSDNPLTDYNRRGDVVGLLVDHGWLVILVTAEKTFFRRPGGTHHKTSGDFHHGLRIFSVFTTSTVFKPQTPYNPSAVYALLECGGDFRRAAKKLARQGFGKSYSDNGWADINNLLTKIK